MVDYWSKHFGEPTVKPGEACASVGLRRDQLFSLKRVGAPFPHFSAPRVRGQHRGLTAADMAVLRPLAVMLNAGFSPQSAVAAYRNPSPLVGARTAAPITAAGNTTP